MKLAVQVLEGPYNHQAADSAYHFIKAAQAKGHEIVGVFFYHDGVANVSDMADPPSDDRNIQNRWGELGKGGVDIVACIAASKRRGIRDDHIVEGTRISGLGQLTDMTIGADRLVTFG